MKKKKALFHRFQPKKTALEAGILNNLTDIHSHYLPDVDDGFEKTEDTIAALRVMVDWGVKCIYFTPHVMSDLPCNKREFLKERFADFLKIAPDGITFRLGAEYMLDASFYDHMKDGLLPLGENHVLIEMSYMSPSPQLTNIIYDLQMQNYIPLLAHPERYLFMSEKQYGELKEKGCRFQLNLTSLAGQYGQRVHDVAWFLLQQGMYDFVGSDIHNLNVFRHKVNLLRLTKEEQELVHKLVRKNDLLR